VLTAAEAFDRLRDGNARFASGQSEVVTGPTRRAELVTSQEPFAVVLGCADSRVPAEIVFDQGLGDLFVIRVAGNIVAPSQVDSVEFAVGRFGTPLVVVLGHTRCGAVQATVDALTNPTEDSRQLASIVNRVRPAVESVLASSANQDTEAVLRDAVRANIRTSVERLRSGSEKLRYLTDDAHVVVVGAEYSLETGVVDFLSDA
jgi:carbonic anhydrase